MTFSNEKRLKRASAGRREEDQVIRRRLSRDRKAFHVGQVITSEIDRDLLFEVIIHQTNEVMESIRSTVFLHDDKTNELWSLVGVGVKKREIRIPSNYGVSGWVFQHRSPVIVNDAYEDPRFYSEVDKKSGFRTKNIICIPLINWAGRCIGALQSLNKTSGDFTDDDRELLTFISNYVTVALENMRLFEELKDLNKARERAINHLSHELQTPLALIGAIFDRCSKGLQKEEDPKFVTMINRGRRNVDRLADLQAKIDDILNLRAFEEKDKISHIVESAGDFVEECSEETNARHAEALDLVLKRIESVYGVGDPRPEKIILHELLNDISNKAISSVQERDLEIIRDFEKGHVVDTDEKVLRKVFGGLLKNAIENTPDEGKVEVSIRCTDHEICVDFRDYGLGISPQNQKLIFQGFFTLRIQWTIQQKDPTSSMQEGADLISCEQRFSRSVTDSRWGLKVRNASSYPMT